MAGALAGFWTFLPAAGLAAENPQESKPEPAKESPAKASPTPDTPPPVVREAVLRIGQERVPYRVTSAKLILKHDDGKPRASVFHVAYERSDVSNPATRPVMFLFNGGPGSSSVWLHLGGLGPKVLVLPGDGTTAPPPPARLTDNPLSILDVCDLVFVDPVSTGYSRPESGAKAEEFHGLDEDIESTGDFIRRWITDHGRWGSPKYLLGESYGGIRVAGLARHLQSRHGMSLNGVVLLSSLLDFQTLQGSPANDLSHLVFLPVFTATAHHHGKLQGDRDALLAESRQFAFGDYAAALLLGSDLPPNRRAEIAARLASLTGIPAETWQKWNLRMGPSAFRAELLRAEGKVLGRFDARVAWDAGSEVAQMPEYDPSYSLALGAFSTAMLDYLGEEGLGWKEERPYEILTGRVQPWKWNANNSIVQVGDRLATALRDNPHLRVLVMGGLTDLATPPDGVEHSLRHLHSLSPDARKRVSFTYYEAGHMFYLNPPDLQKTRKDLVSFLQSSLPTPAPPID